MPWGAPPMMRPIEVSEFVRVPIEALTVSVSRSSGPGGQNVNKVSSKVDVRLDVSKIVGLHPEACERLLLACKSRIDANGFLQFISQKTRDQAQNLDDAFDKIRFVVRAAIVRPIKRRPTRPGRGAVQRRLTDKKEAGERKASRKKSGNGDGD